MTVFLAGLAFGAAGSLHCLLMCGPLLSIVAPNGWRAAVHHGSRIATYVVFGLAAGLVGAGGGFLGLGRWLAWIAAAGLIAGAARAWFGRSVTGIFASPHAARLISRLRGASRRYPRATPMILGATNGLLPCGVVYAAAMAAVGLGTVTGAVLFMLGFGTGTCALLVPAGAIQPGIRKRLSPRLHQLIPVGLLGLAALLILRGWTGLVAHAH